MKVRDYERKIIQVYTKSGSAKNWKYAPFFVSQYSFFIWIQYHVTKERATIVP